MILFGLIGLIVTGVAVVYFRCPFQYPYYEHTFDVSGKRLPKMEDYIDRLLISDHMREINQHFKMIEAWKRDSMAIVERSIFRSHRRRQLERCIDDQQAFVFIFVRSQTRYQQWNYVKQAYKVQNVEKTVPCNYTYLKSRYDKLMSIGGEQTLFEYQMSNQRKLMTKELRRAVMERDNYTCQKCGKYMPDEVGLHIDHVVPVSKGGKSVMSNLQVLCSKCNLSKSNKT